MTTICFKDGILAFDSRITTGDTILPKDFFKGIKTKEVIAAFSGEVSYGQAFLQWVKDGMDPEKAPKTLVVHQAGEIDALVIDRKGNLVHWTSGAHSEGMLPIKLGKVEYYAVGSGSDFALAAMACGASAVEAVEIACKFSPHSAPPVNTLTFKKKKRT